MWRSMALDEEQRRNWRSFCLLTLEGPMCGGAEICRLTFELTGPLRYVAKGPE